MTFSDSMFLLELFVEEFESFMRCKEFHIKSEFLDVFTLYLKEPNDFDKLKHIKYKEAKRISKVRNKQVNQNNSIKIKSQTSQSVQLTNGTKWLIAHMHAHPLELSLWSKKQPSKKLGNVCIPWKKSFFSYLNKLQAKQDLKPLKVKGMYYIENRSKSKCMAIITLSVKLTYLKEKKSNDSYMFAAAIKRSSTNIQVDKTDCLSDKIEKKIVSNAFGRKFYEAEHKQNCLLNIVKSDTLIDIHSSEDLLRVKSLPSIDLEGKLNPLAYIFGCPGRNFGNRVYCVNYFTVENDNSGKPYATENTFRTIDDPHKARYHLKLCDSNCLKKHEDGGSQSVCSIDLPKEASHLVNITKCKHIECNNKKHREPSSPPDDRILLDISNLKTECCQFTEKIEEVVGGVSGKMKIGEDPCYCTCECRFGFTKKTTYCTVCGGYEIVGEEVIPTTGNQMPFPCPIFHKLVDKNKLKNWSTSGSESKKKGDDQSVKSMKESSGQKTITSTKRLTTKSVESEKDIKKRTNKKKVDRFQFNYGYKGIPPQIGHSECTAPCAGTLSSVPKKMGWLWTAADIPGMKVKSGWKPGAISKRLLKALNKAKLRRSIIEHPEPRRVKKRNGEKPALVVCKKDGAYRVELNAARNSKESTPLIYRIEAADNKAKIKKKEKKRRRLVRAAVKEAQSSLFYPDNCENICLPVYEESVFGHTIPRYKDCEEEELLSCSCTDEEISSSCSSTDIDWELHFSPPSALPKRTSLANI